MRRSVVTARASLSTQAAQKLCATRNHKVLSSKTLTLVDQSPHFPTRSSLCQTLRFLSQLSENPSDSDSAEGQQLSLDFGENGDTQRENLTLGNGLVGEEKGDTQMNIFSLSDVELEEVEEVYEIDLEQLESLLFLLQSSADGCLESGFDGLNLTLHPKFVIKVVETPLVLGENLIRFFKWALKEKPEFVLDALVRATCSSFVRKRDVYSLWDLVKEVGEKENSVLHVQILNDLISSFSKLGKGKAALEVFNKFGDFGCVPNADTYYFTIEALCRRSIFGWAQSVCEKMLDAGILPDGEKVGRIISWFCKGKKAKDAHLVYSSAADVKTQYLPLASVYFLISSLFREDETMIFAVEARKYAIQPFSAVVRGLCRIKDVDGAKKLLLEMTMKGPPPGNAVFNMVISGYCKAGDMGEAIEMMNLMKSRGLKPDVYTYTVIMSGYTNGGQMEEACKILSEAKNKHPKLSPVTYHTLIRGYCKLEEFDKGLKLLREMAGSGFQPNIDEYNKLIQSLCLKALDWETVEKLLEVMKDNGLHLNGITRGLIKAVKELKEEKIETENVVAGA
ncbi:hypothetical protein ACE6H2_022617 [Prunus campanulata]